MAGVIDEFDQLLPFKWRDVEVPVTKVKVSLAHDLVEHKYWGRDGARVEATGMAPMRVQASIPLGNRIYPGRGERWQAGRLYPGALRKLVEAFQQRKVGVLQHPEFGEIFARGEKLDVDMSGDRRNMVEVEASWVQTLGDSDFQDLFPSPIQLVQEAGADLDANTADLKGLLKGYTLPEYEATFDDFARSIAAVGDQVGLLAYRAAGRINSIVYRVDQVMDSIDRAKSAFSWPARQAAERVKDAAHDLNQKLLAASNRGIGFTTVPADTTLAGLLALVPAGNTVGDLVKLNPQLMAQPTVPAGTRVRFYEPGV